MAALEDLIEAVKAQTAETQRLISVTEKLVMLRTEAIDHVKQAAAPAEKPAPKAKAEPKTAEPKAEAPKEEVKAAAATPVANDITLDMIREAIADGETPPAEFMKKVAAGYINWGGSEEAPVSTEEREARKAKVKELLAHPKIKADTVAAIPEGARKAALKKFVEWIEALAPAAVADEEVDDL